MPLPSCGRLLIGWREGRFWSSALPKKWELIEPANRRMAESSLKRCYVKYRCAAFGVSP